MFNFLHHQMLPINLLVTESLYFSMIYKTPANIATAKRTEWKNMYKYKSWKEAKVFHSQSYCLGLKWDFVGNFFVVF